MRKCEACMHAERRVAHVFAIGRNMETWGDMVLSFSEFCTFQWSARCPHQFMKHQHLQCRECQPIWARPLVPLLGPVPRTRVRRWSFGTCRIGADVLRRPPRRLRGFCSPSCTLTLYTTVHEHQRKVLSCVRISLPGQRLAIGDENAIEILSAACKM